jgi:hypothetical protein
VLRICGGNQLPAQRPVFAQPQPLPDYPSRLDRLLELDLRRILFAHDLAVEEPH